MLLDSTVQARLRVRSKVRLLLRPRHRSHRTFPARPGRVVLRQDQSPRRVLVRSLPRALLRGGNVDATGAKDQRVGDQDEQRPTQRAHRTRLDGRPHQRDRNNRRAPDDTLNLHAISTF